MISGYNGWNHLAISVIKNTEKISVSLSACNKISKKKILKELYTVSVMCNDITTKSK